MKSKNPYPNYRHWKPFLPVFGKSEKKRDITNYEHIAFELGMSRSAYWRLENGGNFNLKTLIKLCKLLEVTFEEFFQGIDCPKLEKKRKK